MQSLALTIDGIDWPLDATGRTAYQTQVPGAHVALATAIDTSGNWAQAELLLAVTQAGDVDAPVVSFARGVTGKACTAGVDLTQVDLFANDFKRRTFRVANLELTEQA